MFGFVGFGFQRFGKDLGRGKAELRVGNVFLGWYGFWVLGWARGKVSSVELLFMTYRMMKGLSNFPGLLCRSSAVSLSFWVGNRCALASSLEGIRKRMGMLSHRFRSFRKPTLVGNANQHQKHQRRQVNKKKGPRRESKVLS